ncbi:hypothetical protein RUM43_002758 [Polyplax serrata]|uniref:Uncharacterized protein n=1 Tax=Polyplax serrata TaxID=468196 RepID=A0AAN8S996_POLSC
MPGSLWISSDLGPLPSASSKKTLSFRCNLNFLPRVKLFVSGQTTTGTSPPLGTSASSLSPGSSSAGVGPGAISPNGSAAPGPGSTASGTSCCENGRPIMTDPVSGQTVCSCQYDPSRLTLSYPRLSTSGVGVYGTPYPSTDQNPYPSIGVDSSAFYSPLVINSKLDEELQFVANLACFED